MWADKLGASAGSQSNLVKRIIRATCLDPETHREVANNNGLNNEAGIALAIGLAGTAIGNVIWLPYVGGFNVKLILVQLLMSACSMAAFIFAVSLLSQSIAGRKAEPLVVFRLVAYCAALGVVTIVPVVGPLLTLWLLASTTVALKEIANQDLGKAIILVVIGAVGAVVVNMVISPVIVRSMMGTGGFF